MQLINLKNVFKSVFSITTLAVIGFSITTQAEEGKAQMAIWGKAPLGPLFDGKGLSKGLMEVIEIQGKAADELFLYLSATTTQKTLSTGKSSLDVVAPAENERSTGITCAKSSQKALCLIAVNTTVRGGYNVQRKLSVDWAKPFFLDEMQKYARTIKLGPVQINTPKENSNKKMIVLMGPLGLAITQFMPKTENLPIKSNQTFMCFPEPGKSSRKSCLSFLDSRGSLSSELMSSGPEMDAP